MVMKNIGFRALGLGHLGLGFRVLRSIPQAIIVFRPNVSWALLPLKLATLLGPSSSEACNTDPRTMPVP